MLGGEPGQGLPVVGEDLGGDAGLGGARVIGSRCGLSSRSRRRGRCAGSGRAAGAGRGAPVVLGVVRVGQFGGVRAQQVVQGVPARDVLGDQVRAGQLGQQRPDLRRAGARRGWPPPARRCRGRDAAPSSRNSRAASALSCWYDQENTARTSVAASPPSNASRPPRASRSSAASAASGNSGWVAARAATIASANGSRAQEAMMSSTASGSAATRSGAEAAGEQLAAPRRRSAGRARSRRRPRPRPGW